VVKIQIVDWDKSENVAVREIAGYVARDLRVGHVSLAFFPYQPGYPFDDLGRALTSIKQRGRHKYEQ